METTEEVPLPIPATLKSHLEDDCFWILSRHKLLRLPRRPNVEDLLRQYYYHTIATPTEDTSPALLAEALDGIKTYFDFMTEDHLLYAAEREQFKTFIADYNRTISTSDRANSTSENNTLHLEHTSNCHLLSQIKPTSLVVPSQVYGVEHLLRLFLRLPHFLCRAQLPSSHIQVLHHIFKDFLSFLSSRRELFSENNYETVLGAEHPVTGGDGVVQATPTNIT